MSDYKLVPVEITDEMAEASGCEGCFRKSVHDQAQDMWTAMLAAAPAAQGEPVAEEVTLLECVSCNHLYQGQVTLCDCMPEEQKFNRWLARPERAEQKPDVARLVEALEDIAGTHHHSTSAGEYFAKVARKALAAYRKGARNEDD